MLFSMTLQKLGADDVGYPHHPAVAADEGGFFALSSHKRAREAIRFGLDMQGVGFNIFVLGEDRSGRMNATLALLEGYVRNRPPPDDWVYLNNFRRLNQPQPHRLPAGQGTRLRQRLTAVAPKLRGTTLEEALVLVDEVIAEFRGVGDIDPWLAAWRRDVEERRATFASAPTDTLDGPERRYGVNLLVDHGEESHPAIVIEPNQTFENLFGRIEYMQTAGGLVTDFTMIRAGALHRANGGILVLRAEALARDNPVWEFLKASLRDQKIRIEELHRAGSVPIASAPRPLPIPFDAKVVIVGAPRWYYGTFLNDPEFRVYFKVKADICDDLRAVPENVAAFVGMISRMADAHGGRCTDDAVATLLGIAARWAEHRNKFSSRLELLDDLLGEAVLLARPSIPQGDSGTAAAAVAVTGAHVEQAMRERRRRVSQVEDRMHRIIAEGGVMVSTTGTAVGQVNGLIVFNRLDHQYGCPCRVTARSWIGARGVVNIDRDANLGGPIQQKGVLGLQGFLAGTFARTAPISFSCSLTFEQNYVGIEGDSASLAELLAILSDLSGIPLRQDLAVTGSVNQHGDVQPVSGVNHKVEAFYRTCCGSEVDGDTENAGQLTGSQGVIIPAVNRVNLVLRPEITAAIAAGRFHIWTAARVEDAIELFTGQPVDVVYDKVAACLADFDRILCEREGGAHRRGG